MWQNRLSTVIRVTLTYDNPRLKMSHEDCALVWHFQPRVHDSSMSPSLLCIIRIVTVMQWNYLTTCSLHLIQPCLSHHNVEMLLYRCCTDALILLLQCLYWGTESVYTSMLAGLDSVASWGLSNVWEFAGFWCIVIFFSLFIHFLSLSW